MTFFIGLVSIIFGFVGISISIARIVSLIAERRECKTIASKVLESRLESLARRRANTKDLPYRLTGAPKTGCQIMKKIEIPAWVRNGAPVKYRPVFGPKDSQGIVYSGILEGEPYLMGNPQNRRWVVRIVDLDDDYAKMFGRSVVPNASLNEISPICPCNEMEDK